MRALPLRFSCRRGDFIPVKLVGDGLQFSPVFAHRHNSANHRTRAHHRAANTAAVHFLPPRARRSNRISKSRVARSDRSVDANSARTIVQGTSESMMMPRHCDTRIRTAQMVQVTGELGIASVNVVKMFTKIVLPRTMRVRRASISLLDVPKTRRWIGCNRPASIGAACDLRLSCDCPSRGVAMSAAPNQQGFYAGEAYGLCLKLPTLVWREVFLEAGDLRPVIRLFPAYPHSQRAARDLQLIQHLTHRRHGVGHTFTDARHGAIRNTVRPQCLFTHPLEFSNHG